MSATFNVWRESKRVDNVLKYLGIEPGQEIPESEIWKIAQRLYYGFGLNVQISHAWVTRNTATSTTEKGTLLIVDDGSFTHG